MRGSAGVLLALAALPAAAQEGGRIRTGEHEGFTRVVMTIEPTTEWSLETRDGEAVIFFPGRPLAFGTDGVFERIPRTRVTSIEASRASDGARVAVGIGCDCRISASIVGARYLALDVADRGVVAAAAPAPAGEDATARTRREGAAVASAEAALIEQITRAADQGIIQLAGATPAEPAADVVPEVETSQPAPAAPAPAQVPREASETLAELALHDQIEAISVYDRDRASVAGARPPTAVPPVCLPDDALDVSDWSDGRSLTAQTPALMRRMVREFDKPDPEALRDLARLYIRFGFGAEAENLLAGFEVEMEDRPLLADLARAVEDRPVAPDGPLALDAVCPGRHGLWLAVAGVAPVYRDPEGFATVQAAFAELPVDLRALIGPQLAGRLLEAGRPEEARLIQVTAIRPGLPLSVELALVGAQLDAADGRRAEALTALRALAESGAHNATDALIALAELAAGGGLALPERLVTDLRGAALTQRGDPREVALRVLLVQALAGRGSLPEALAEVRAARADLPGASRRFARAGVTALAAADPDAVGASIYAETAIAAAPLFLRGPADDAARAAVAARLVEIGLPNAALTLLRPALVRADPDSRRLAARAELALGRPGEALSQLRGLAGAQTVTLRAEALAKSGAPGAAIAALAAAGAEAETLPLAWVSGDWARAREAAVGDPARAAMAGYMSVRAGGVAVPAADPAAPTPEDAFQSVPPRPGPPSLGSARELLANGRQVGGFVGALLQSDPAPAE